MIHHPLRSLWALPTLLALGALAACAHAPQASERRDTVPAWPAASWQAPLPGGTDVVPRPHQGDLAQMRAWWAALGDPVLLSLIEAAQAASPTVAQAASRRAQAQAALVGARAASGPALDAVASLQRGQTQPSVPLAAVAQAGLQAAWEWDVFGAAAAGQQAAQARLAGAQAQWHDARVTVAAETALAYLGWRSSEAQARVAQHQAQSQEVSARLSGLSARAGLTAPATDALAQASVAEARSRVWQWQAQSAQQIKALVALTALNEQELKQKMAQSLVDLSLFASKNIANPVESLPAQTLAQRPDLWAAETEIEAARADLGQARAARYPRVSLTGSIGHLSSRALGTQTDLSTWSIGPLAISVPIFDGGRREAAVDLAQARFEEAVALYQARARLAVREVEEALVTLDATARRQQEADVVQARLGEALAGAQARLKAGLASVAELEELRRTALNAQSALIGLQQERLAAWVALYRAAGGGWSRPDATTLAAR